MQLSWMPIQLTNHFVRFHISYYMPDINTVMSFSTVNLSHSSTLVLWPSGKVNPTVGCHKWKSRAPTRNSRMPTGTAEQGGGTAERRWGTTEHGRGTAEHRRGTAEHGEGTAERQRGTAEHGRETAERRWGAGKRGARFQCTGKSKYEEK